MKIYRVNLSTIAYIAAESEFEAQITARALAGRIMDDDINPEVDVEYELKSVSGIRSAEDGWDANCIPYGHGDDKTIEQILVAR